MKTVPYIWCEWCQKRGFEDEYDADKALGKAKAKRRRQMESSGTRRGHRMESRFYECENGLFHLTGESKREHHARAGDGRLTWDEYLAGQGQAAVTGVAA